MTYDIAGHPLLEPDAAALSTGDDGELTAQADVAEMALDAALRQQGLPSFTRPPKTDPLDVKRATLAVVLQVNLQVASGVDAFVYKRTRDGMRDTEWAGLVVHPLALATVTDLVTVPPDGAAPDPAAAYRSLQSLRTNDGPRRAWNVGGGLAGEPRAY
jgi:hypothetical protein